MRRGIFHHGGAGGPFGGRHGGGGPPPHGYGAAQPHAYGAPQPQAYGAYPQAGYPGAYGAPQTASGAPQTASYSSSGAQPSSSASHSSSSSSSSSSSGSAQPPGTPLTGRMKSLVIGINYYGQQGQLGGCVNDALMMQRFLSEQGFPTDSNSMRVLTDSQGQSHSAPTAPTRKNITDGMRWLVEGAKPGDSLFLHYSGHGSQEKDKDGDEEDGMDETIVPVDYQTAGQMNDDELFSLLCHPLPRGCRLTAVMDCCHSGSALDLPYEFVATQKALSNPGVLRMMAKRRWGGGGHVGGGGQRPFRLGRRFGRRGMPPPPSGTRDGLESAGGRDEVEGEVIMFSGCADEQTSADLQNAAQSFQTVAVGPGGSGGACTNALIAAHAANPRQSYVDLLKHMRESLVQRGFKQVPQLSSSVEVDLYREFSLHHLLG